MHPLTTNLTLFTDDELHKKYAELQKKFTQAYRSGPQAIIPQLQMVMEDYQSEINRRNQKNMEELLQRSEKDGKSFKGIIDIQ